MSADPTIDVHAHVVLEETFGTAGAHGPELGEDCGVPWFRAGTYRLEGVRYRGSAFMDPQLRLAAMAFVIVALEGVHSDLISSYRPFGRFLCGNFGLILLSQASARKVDRLLRRMLEITMMRGAQSAGLVTYQERRGVRYRVGARMLM